MSARKQFAKFVTRKQTAHHPYKGNIALQSTLPTSFPKSIPKEFEAFYFTPETRDFFNKHIESHSLVRKRDKYLNGEKYEAEKPLQPSMIQRLVWHEYTKKRNPLNEKELRTFVVAAETGSGKTYSYLVPIVNDLLKQKAASKSAAISQQSTELEEDLQTKPSKISAIVLVPTRELMEQFRKLMDDLKELGLSTVVYDYQLRARDVIIGQDIDILVTTPSKLQELPQRVAPHIVSASLCTVKHCVIEEADLLFDDKMLESSIWVLHQLKLLSNTFLVSSTFSLKYEAIIKRVAPHASFKLLASPGLHKVNSKVKTSIVDCDVKPFNGSKLRALKHYLYLVSASNSEQSLPFKKVLVFVNRVDAVESLYQSLVEEPALKGFDLYRISGQMAASERLQSLREFDSMEDGDSEEAPATPAPTGKPQKTKTIPNSNLVIPSSKTVPDSAEPPKQKVKVLITTDILSKGYNFELTNTVFLYDIPNMTSDLLNRIGRVGRFYMSGKCYIFAQGNEKKSWLLGLPKSISKKRRVV